MNLIIQLMIIKMVNCMENNKKLADKEEKTIFGGRLGEYKYYDMDATIDSVLNLCEKEFGDR